MKNILVIDDSPTIRVSVQFALKSLEATICQAENGKDGVAVVEELLNKKNEIDFCIVDINMPEMDGITFIQHFRKKNKFTPILVLTTESEESQIQRGKQAGASGWLVKPFKPDDLLNIVRKLMN